MEKIKEYKRDPRLLMFEIRKRRKDILFWLTAIFVSLLIIIFICSKDISCFLALSSITQSLSFIIILIKIMSYQSCSGISPNSLICYEIVLFSRLLSTLTSYGYVPEDVSGAWIYQFSEIISFLICGLILYLLYFQYKETSDLLLDTKIPFYYLAIPTFLFSLIFRTDLNENLFTDISWAFSMYLETLAIFPQITLFVVKKGQIESFTSHFVALAGLSRLFSLIFWWFLFDDLNSTGTLLGPFVGYIIIGAQIIQLFFMADYYYLYFKSICKGKEINSLDI